MNRLAIDPNNANTYACGTVVPLTDNLGLVLMRRLVPIFDKAYKVNTKNVVEFNRTIVFISFSCQGDPPVLGNDFEEVDWYLTNQI